MTQAWASVGVRRRTERDGGKSTKERTGRPTPPDGRDPCRGAPPTPHPHQYHVTRGDVHVGVGGLLAPGGGAAAGRGADGRAPLAELGRHAVDARLEGLERLGALRRRFDRHPLATQLLGDRDGERHETVSKLPPRKQARSCHMVTFSCHPCPIGD